MKKENKKEEALTLENCPEIMDGEEVAKIFHISSRTVFDLAMSGQLESFKIGRCRKYTKRALYRYVYELTGDEAYNPDRKEEKEALNAFPSQIQKSSSGFEASL